MPVTLLLLARNEEALIAECLSSVAGWLDEMIVVDMQSRDATADIARNLGAKVIPHPLIGNFDLARTPGILAARNDWILVLDADEIPTPGLLTALAELIHSDRADVIHLPRANLSLSGFSVAADGFPELTPRLFRRSKMDIRGYRGKIHTFYAPLPDARIARLPGSFPLLCLLHFTNPSLGLVWEKTGLYASEEAKSRFPADFRPRPWHLLHPLRVFLRRWIKGGGWRDGWRGFWLSWLASAYHFLVLAKRWEMTLYDGQIPDAAMARSRMWEIVRKASEKA